MCKSPPSYPQTTIIVRDLTNQAEAIEVAKKIAEKTGKKVTIRDSDGDKIETIFPTEH